MTVDNGSSDWVHVDVVEAETRRLRGHIRYLLDWIGADDVSSPDLEKLGAPPGIVAARAALTESDQ